MRKPLLILMSLLLLMLPSVALPQATNNSVTVPEPSTILLLVSGLLGLWGFRKKFKK